ncbi:MAG: MFS transporter [Candidatus Hermodarchaeota archaeon]
MSIPKNLLNLNITTLTLSHFLWGFVNFIYIIQIQPHLLSIYGTSPETAQILGLLLSIGNLSAVIPLLMGFFADAYGRKNLIIFGEILCILGLFGLSFGGTDIILLLPSIILFNLGLGFYDPPLQGLIYESTEKRGLAFSLIYNSSYVAGIIASFLIQLEGNTNLTRYFQIGFILVIIGLIVNILMLRDFFPNTEKVDFPILKILREPHSRLIAFTFALDAFLWGLPLAIANGIYIILFQVDVSFIATLTLVQTFVLVILQYPAGWIVDRFGRIIGLIMGELLGFVWIFFVLVAIETPHMATELLIIAYAFLGAVVSFWRPSVTLSFISIDPSAASTNFGILSFFQRLGRVPTAVVGGFLFPYIGFSPLLLITFFGTLIIIGLFYKIVKLEANIKT